MGYVKLTKTAIADSVLGDLRARAQRERIPTLPVRHPVTGAVEYLPFSVISGGRPGDGLSMQVKVDTRGVEEFGGYRYFTIRVQEHA